MGKFEGFIRPKNDKKKNKVSGAIKAFLRLKLANPLIFVTIVVVTILLIVALVYELLHYQSDIDNSRNNPELLYDIIGADDLNELICIAGNEEDGYYLAFKEGIDEKLDEIVEEYKKPGYQEVSKEILLKMIQAELYTQYPDLGGKIGHEAKLDNDEIEEKEVTETKSKITSLEGFLFIGDSITYDMQQYGVADVECIFKGASGKGSQYWIDHFSSLPQDSDDIKGINVLLGTNDYGNNNASETMKKLLEKLHEKYSDKIIYVDKLLPDLSSGVDSAKRSQYISDIKTFCGTKSYLIYIDPTSDVNIGEGDCHPASIDDYKTLWNNIKKEILNSNADSEIPLQIGEDTGEGLEGFQGAIRIRRVTPNKTIGVVANTGAGEISSTQTTQGEAAGDVREYLNENAKDGKWSVYAKNLATSEEMVKINGDMQLQSASLIKLFVMATAYQEMSEGRTIDNAESLIEQMITVSDNDATNTLIEKLGMNTINEYIQSNGYSKTQLSRLMRKSSVNGDNYTSVSDVAKILEEIYNGKCVSKEASAKMLKYLKAQQRTKKIPAGVPSGVVTANKTGELDTVENDAAIVYKEGAPYILVVMSSGLSDTAKARENIVEVSKIVYEKIDKQETEDNSQSEEEHVIAVVAGHGDSEGAKKEWYTTGTEDSTGVTNPAWKEKDITLKVANYVKQIFESQYPQFKIVTDGYSEKNEDRLKIAKDAGAEMFIGVHFNGNDSSSVRGTGVYYEAGTDYVDETKKLANALQESIMEEMGTPKGEGVTSSNSYTAFNNGRQNEFGGPALYVEGAYMSNKEDMEIIAKENEEGLKSYAKGIVAGILEYYGIENKGYGELDSASTTTDETVTTSINSRIYDLKYIPEEKFDELIDNQDEKVLQYYTLDGSWKLVTAKWNYSSDEGITFTKNMPINYKTVVQKYTTPFEYLLDFYINIKNDDFIKDFADLALDSEFIIAVQDNVTTTSITTEKNVVFKDNDGKTSSSTSTEVKITESVSEAIELTYADTWFVKFSKKSSYSTAALQTSRGTLTGKAGDLIGNYRLTSYCYICNDDGSGNFGTSITASGVNATPNRTIAIHNAASGGDPNGLKLGDKVVIDGNVYVVEDTGTGKPGAWIDVYVNPTSNNRGSCCSNSEFADRRDVPVYLAEDVREVSEDELQSVDTKSFIDVVSNVMGKTTENTSYSMQSYYAPAVNGTSTVTVTTETKRISAKYETGDVDVSKNEEKFLKLFEDNPDVLDTLKPDWLITIVSEGRSSVFTDLTKYLMYKLTKENFGVKEKDIEKFLEKFKNNEFRTVNKGGKISYDSLNLTQEDREILYKITSAERGDGTQEQQEYVVSVILNRVLSSEFPNTVKEVVFQPMQFQPTRNGAYERANPSQTTRDAVDNVIENGGTAKTAIYFMTPAAALGQQSWLKDCIFLFNDEDDSLKDTNTNGTHNFYTSEKAKQELEQYMIAGGGTVVENAVKIHQQVRESGQYSYDMNYVKNVPVNPPHIDCSSYVSWVMLECGFEEFRGGQKTSYTFEDNPWKWEVVSLENAQPGDIVTYSGHVEIIADVNEGSDKLIVYNMGGNASINAAGTAELPESSTSGYSKSAITCILRPPVD